MAGHGWNRDIPAKFFESPVLAGHAQDKAVSLPRLTMRKLSQQASNNTDQEMHFQTVFSKSASPRLGPEPLDHLPGPLISLSAQHFMAQTLSTAVSALGCFLAWKVTFLLSVTLEPPDLCPLP